MPVLYTIGYGGRTPSDLLERLFNYDIDWVVDVRIDPGAYLGAFRAGKNIKSLLGPDIGYRWMHELGNQYKDAVDWMYKYTHNLHTKGNIACKALSRLVDKLEFVTRTKVCLLCAERNAQKCHRSIIATSVATKLKEITQANWRVVHIG